MDEREKIAQLLCKQTGSNENRECEPCPFNGCIAQRQADALIAANIGDVAEWKEKAEKAEKERDEYRKSTHIALRGIEILKRNIIRYFATEFPSILQQAEKELQEERKND